jgi:hypothetical protein
MKNIFSVLLISAAFNFCHAQSVNFKIKYLPNHTYQLSGNSQITINTDLSSVPQIANALSAQGITEPVNAVANMQMQSTTTTGAIAADGTTPFNMGFSLPSIAVNVNGKQIPIPMNAAMSNVKMYGHVGTDGKMNVDSLNGKKVADSAAVKALSMMNNMFKMINFPDHPLQPGDTFTQEMPLSLPVGGKGFDINIKITYKLISTDGAKANFDIVQDINMQMNIKDKANVSVIGGGTGKMVYDIANNFPSYFSSSADMKVNVKASGMDINANVTSKGEMNYVVTAK